MSDSSNQTTLPVPRDTFAIFPDDGQANTFSTVETSVYCEHEIDGERRGIGGPREEKPTEFHVVPHGGEGMDGSEEGLGSPLGTDTIAIFVSEPFDGGLIVETPEGEENIEEKHTLEIPPDRSRRLYRYDFEVEPPNPIGNLVTKIPGAKTVLVGIGVIKARINLGMGKISKKLKSNSKVEKGLSYVKEGIDGTKKWLTNDPESDDKNGRFELGLSKRVVAAVGGILKEIRESSNKESGSKGDKNIESKEKKKSDNSDNNGRVKEGVSRVRGAVESSASKVSRAAKSSANKLGGAVKSGVKKRVGVARTYTVKRGDEELDIIVHYADQWQFLFQFPAPEKGGVSNSARFPVSEEDGVIRQSNRREASCEFFNESMDDSRFDWEAIERETRNRNYKVTSYPETIDSQKIEDEGWEVTGWEVTGDYKSSGSSIANNPPSILSELQDSPGGPKVVVKRNNRRLSFKRPFEFVRRWRRLGGSLLKIIGNLQMALGAYVDMNITLVKGSLAFWCGWKECEDEGAFVQVGGAASITLFRARVEAGVGFNLGARFQAYVFIQGKMVLNIPAVQRSGPGKKLQLSFEASDELKGAIGGRGRVPNAFQCKVEGDTAIKLDGLGGSIGAEGLKMDGSIEWTGVNFKVVTPKGTAGNAGSDEEIEECAAIGADDGSGTEANDEKGKKNGRSVGLQTQYAPIEGVELISWSWSWPPEPEEISEESDPDQLSEEEIKDIMATVFSGGEDSESGHGEIKIRERVGDGDEISTPEEMAEPEEVAEGVVETIVMIREDVQMGKMDEETVREMASDIHETLGGYSEEESDDVVVSRTKFIIFLYHGDLDDILDKHTS